ncbi:unnamed protein product [Linum trigynum]|uniref:Uncharacterized protein n=1 Tax=Linum trigynum TaxID=586398 RepID=A0AAV2FW08_9ROSI
MVCRREMQRPLNGGRISLGGSDRRWRNEEQINPRQWLVATHSSVFQECDEAAADYTLPRTIPGTSSFSIHSKSIVDFVLRFRMLCSTLIE